MCTNQILNSQRTQFNYERKSHETMSHRDILNLKLSSAFNKPQFHLQLNLKFTTNNEVNTTSSIKFPAENLVIPRIIEI